MPDFYEFFSGGGMARAGLGPRWNCLFANDIDVKKAESYKANWGEGELLVKDIANIHSAEIEGHADLAWASFPCQDLSLAGNYRGLSGQRSGIFWEFWRIIRDLGREGRSPRIIAIENVCGLLTSNSGADFRAIVSSITSAGYVVGAMIVDCMYFTPQSRPRLFMIGVHESLMIPNGLYGVPIQPWHSDALVKAHGQLSCQEKARWRWWTLPEPPQRNHDFIDILEDEPWGVTWHPAEQTQRLFEMMSPINRRKVEIAEKITAATAQRTVGGIYRRTRNGAQCAEVRFDTLAGCLRTPGGGSSRQSVIIIDRGSSKTRLLSPREAARLMGLPDSYKLPSNYNQAYKLCGDGVAVPAVRFLSDQILMPIIEFQIQNSVRTKNAD